MLLDAALAYLARGFTVIPGMWVGNDGVCVCQRGADCDRPGKHPWVKWLEYEDRQSTEAEVRRWWSQRPNSTVIIVTGAGSGIVVVDIDPRHGGDESWLAWTTEHHVAIPLTPSALTGGGGTHLYFKHPGGIVRNRTDMLLGVDLRGDGGFVLAPPSAHPSGGTYEWDTEAHLDDVPLADMPPALLQLTRTASTKAGSGAASNGHTPGTGSLVDIDGILEGRTRITDGERNNTLAAVAGHFARGGTEFADVLASCMWVNETACEHPLGAAEVERTVDSIVRAESRKPAPGVGPVAGILPAGERPSDPLGVATELWGHLGVLGVVEWALLRGSEEPQYILVTTEAEVRFTDLLDYPIVRSKLLSHLRVGLPVQRQMADWGDRAKMLRDSAIEREVEPTKARERIDEWLDAYSARYQHKGELPEDEWATAIESSPIEVTGVMHLRPVRFKAFVEAQFGEKLTPSDMRRLLSRAGWEEDMLAIGDKLIRTWQREVQ